MSIDRQNIERISNTFFRSTKISLQFLVEKIFFKNVRLGIFLGMFLFFGHSNLDNFTEYDLIVYEEPEEASPMEALKTYTLS